MSPPLYPLVLVVDDDELVRELVGLSLQLYAGWRVVEAASGCEAIEQARLLGPDAIVSDLMMPGLDGIETFHRLQADETTREIPVVLLTAAAMAGSRSWDGVGFAGVVGKPFDVATLASRIAGLIGWSGSH